MSGTTTTAMTTTKATATRDDVDLAALLGAERLSADAACDLLLCLYAKLWYDVATSEARRSVTYRARVTLAKPLRSVAVPVGDRERVLAAASPFAITLEQEPRPGGGLVATSDAARTLLARLPTRDGEPGYALALLRAKSGAFGAETMLAMLAACGRSADA